jgi:hypothetical protein
VVVAALLAVGFLTWAGVTPLLDAWWRRCDRPDLSERLRPYRQRWVTDEAPALAGQFLSYTWPPCDDGANEIRFDTGSFQALQDKATPDVSFFSRSARPSNRDQLHRSTLPRLRSRCSALVNATPPGDPTSRTP